MFVFLDSGQLNDTGTICFDRPPSMIIGIHAFEAFAVFLTVIVAADQHDRLSIEIPYATTTMASLFILHITLFILLFASNLSHNIRAFLFGSIKLLIALMPQIFAIGGKYRNMRILQNTALYSR